MVVNIVFLAHFRVTGDVYVVCSFSHLHRSQRWMVNVISQRVKNPSFAFCFIVQRRSGVCHLNSHLKKKCMSQFPGMWLLKIGHRSICLKSIWKLPVYKMWSVGLQFKCIMAFALMHWGITPNQPLPYHVFGLRYSGGWEGGRGGSLVETSFLSVP